MHDASGRLPLIDALRGYAVVAVVLLHVYSPLVNRAGWWHVGALQITPLFWLTNGVFAVPLFFLLSGFVLALPYLSGKRAMDGVSDMLSYAKRRAARLLPLYWLGFLIPLVAIYGWLETKYKIDFILWMGSMAYVVRPDMIFPGINRPLWSLGVEFWLSVAFPFLLLAVRRFGVRKVVLATLLVSFASRLAAVFLYDRLGPLVVIQGPLSQLDLFACGILLADMHLCGVRSKAPLFHLAAGVTFVTFTCLLKDSIVAETLTWDAMPLMYCVATCGITLIVHALLGMQGPAMRLFANAPIRQMGKMCYSCYVWHYPWLVVLLLNPANALTPTIFLYVAAVLVTTLFSYRYIEFGHVADASKLFVFPRLQRSTPSREESGTASMVLA